LSLNEWIAMSELLWIWKIRSWKEDDFFPIEIASIVKIWEQTWKLPDLLIKIASKYNKEIDVIVKWLSTAIEPVVIIWVWCIVWTMIMAILLPFFNMVNVI
jgi:type IV pilus assembly protein PilC